MILRCPRCGTRYRHDRSPEGSKACCSRCSEVFPFPVAARSYRVLADPCAAAAVAVPLGSGFEAPVPGAIAEPSPARAGGNLARPPGGQEAFVSVATERQDAGVEELDRLLEAGSRAAEPNPLARPVLLVATAVALAWGLGGESFAAWVGVAFACGFLARWGFRWASRKA